VAVAAQQRGGVRGKKAVEKSMGKEEEKVEKQTEPSFSSKKKKILMEEERFTSIVCDFFVDSRSLSGGLCRCESSLRRADRDRATSGNTKKKEGARKGEWSVAKKTAASKI